MLVIVIINSLLQLIFFILFQGSIVFHLLVFLRGASASCASTFLIAQSRRCLFQTRAHIEYHHFVYSTGTNIILLSCVLFLLKHCIRNSNNLKLDSTAIRLESLFTIFEKLLALSLPVLISLFESILSHLLELLLLLDHSFFLLISSSLVLFSPLDLLLHDVISFPLDFNLLFLL